MNTKSKKTIRQQITSLNEIGSYFLKLGVTSFGGPLAVVGILQRDLVESKNWISKEEFTQAFTMIKAMPGPISFMMSTYVGRRRGGILGGLVAAVCFVLPAFFMILILAEYYQQFEKFDVVRRFLSGLQISAFALIIYAMKGLVQKDYKKPLYLFLGGLAAAAFHYEWLPEPVIILGFGAVYAFVRKMRSAPPAVMGLAMFEWDERYWILFQKCLKAGALVFGTGFAILPVLRNDFVVNLKWISESEFLNALAFGQMTPGPVVITTTYIGYKVLGLGGGLLATIGVFAPSFLHIQTWFYWALSRMQKARWIHDFVFASSAAVAGTLFVTLFKIGYQIHWTWPLSILFLTSLGFFFFIPRVPSLLVVLIAGICGMLI